MDYKLLNVVLEGLSDSNIRFQALVNLLKNLNFPYRVKGDHYIFFKNGVEEIINLQPLKGGKAKAYQVKQVRKLIHKYKLHGEGKDV